MLCSFGDFSGPYELLHLASFLSSTGLWTDPPPQETGDNERENCHRTLRVLDSRSRYMERVLRSFCGVTHFETVFWTDDPLLGQFILLLRYIFLLLIPDPNSLNFLFLFR